MCLTAVSVVYCSIWCNTSKIHTLDDSTDIERRKRKATQMFLAFFFLLLSNAQNKGKQKWQRIKKLYYSEIR